MVRRSHAQHTSLHLPAPFPAYHSLRFSPGPLDSKLLNSKLMMPLAKPYRIVTRACLAALDSLTEYPLTLVCAPTGYGKTTLLTQWSGASVMPIAWLTVDPRDNDPARFWTYVAAALDRTVPGILDTVLPLVNTAHPPESEPIVTALINALAAAPEPRILILDDYHTLDRGNSAIHEAMAYLLEHLPSRTHIVIASRQAPPLPLARLRMQDSVLEIRTPDLAFTLVETGTFLNDRMRLGLTPAEVAALHSRTEGWIAALQLAALSLRNRQDSTQAIAAFSGRDPHIFAMFMDEVLGHVPEETQRFLLQTSILDRIGASIAEAVTESGHSLSALEALERANLFLVPLDDEHQWYRYHDLFAEALRLRLEQTQPELVPVLYRRAGAWCEAHNYMSKAIDFACAAGDMHHAADLIEREASARLAEGRVATVLRWLERLPQHAEWVKPHLGVLHAFVLLLNSQFPECARRLDIAIEHHNSRVDLTAPEDRALLNAEIQSLRAAMAFLIGDLKECVALCRQALAVLPEGHLFRAHTLMTLGRSLWLDGTVEAANEIFIEVKRESEQDGNTYNYSSAISLLGQVRLLQGKVDEALALCRHAVQYLARYGKAGNACGIFAVWGMASYERNALDAAAEHFDRAAELSARQHNAPVTAYSQLMLSHIRQLQGMAPETHGAADKTWLWRWYADYIEAQRARLSIVRGDVELADAWVRIRERLESQRRREGTSQVPQPLLVREWEHLVTARVYLAEGNAPAALQELTALPLDMEASGRILPLLESLVLRVAALAALDALPAARETLRRALALAQPYGLVRTFVDGGPVIRRLLAGMYAGEAEHVPAAGTLTAYALSLLESLGETESVSAQYTEKLAIPESLATAAGSDVEARTSPVDTLSTRELEVLSLMARGASNEDIAHELVIAIGTVKRHVSNIFIKLGTCSRTQTVVRAHALQLIDLNRTAPQWKLRTSRRPTRSRPRQD